MFDIEVSLHHYKPFNHIQRGRLQLLLSGKDCNNQFINALGRIAVKRIPSYAFPPELIKIEKIKPESGYHDSIPFNYDMMRKRIKNTPIVGVDPGFAFLHEKYWKNVDYLSPDREVHEQEKRIEAFIDAKNTADEGNDEQILDVTTNDMKIYIDNELTEIYSKEYPFLIISLKPKEAFKCSMRAVLGLGINESSWDACSRYWFDQETIPDKTIFSCESSSRFDEFTLISRTLEYFRIRTNQLKDDIQRLYLLEEEKTNDFHITIVDEDHTMGEPINYELQSHPDIISSSISKPDHLVRNIVIKITVDKPDKMLSAIMESIDNLIKKIDIFEEKFNKIEGAGKNKTQQDVYQKEDLKKVTKSKKKN